MPQKQRQITFHGWIIAILIIFNMAVLRTAYTEDSNYYWVLLVSIPLLVLVIKVAEQKEDSEDQPPRYSE